MKSRIMRGEAYVVSIGEMRGAFRGLVGKSEGKTPLGKPKRRWENKVKIDF
jgi:hypothetical protein